MSSGINIGLIIGVIVAVAVFYLIYAINSRTRRTFSGKRFAIAAVFLFFTVPYLINDMNLSDPVQLLLVTANIFLLIFSFLAPRIFCADCGQYLGTSPSTCPRCGCNIYTKEFKGVGSTVREGRKNY